LDNLQGVIHNVEVGKRRLCFDGTVLMNVKRSTIDAKQHQRMHPSVELLTKIKKGVLQAICVAEEACIKTKNSAGVLSATTGVSALSKTEEHSYLCPVMYSPVPASGRSIGNA